MERRYCASKEGSKSHGSSNVEPPDTGARWWWYEGGWEDSRKSQGWFQTGERKWASLG
jgi:hypothetical protein